MKKIGITGGIGSGKTIVCSLLETMGYPVFNADVESKKLCNTYEPLKQKLTETFGNIYTSEGELNKSLFASIIFNDTKKLALANSIIHPELIRFFKKWSENQQNKFVFIESAILLESIFVSAVDKIVCISATEDIRIQRVVCRENTTIESVRERIKNQLSENEMIQKSDFVIYNNEKELVIPQVEKLIEDLETLF